MPHFLLDHSKTSVPTSWSGLSEDSTPTVTGFGAPSLPASSFYLHLSAELGERSWWRTTVPFGILVLLSSIGMGILQEFEERLEQAVDTVVAKLFRTELQPVEILRKLARAQDSGKRIFAGRVVAPNVFHVFFSEEDFHRLAPIQARLQEELSLALTRQAAREGWALVSSVEIRLHEKSALPVGAMEVHAEIQEREVSGKGILIAPDGQRIELEDSMLLGRAQECDVILQDTWCSRRHAEIKKSEDGFEITDLNSTNGTFVNEEKIERRVLKSGDALRLGRTTFRFVLA